MEFGLTKEQLRLIDKSRTVARDVLAVHASKYDLEAQHPIESFAALREQGFYGMAVPKEYGGWGLDLVTYCLCMHELAQGCASTATSFNMHNIVLYGIAHLGTEDQKKRWFSKVINEGALIGSWGSEPNASFSSARRSLGTSIVETDGGYRMSGQKYFCSLAGACDYALLFAVPASKIGQENANDIVVGLVSTKEPGVTIQYGWDTLGLRATSSHSVNLENVFIKTDDFLGGPGDWFGHACNQRFEIGYGAIYSGLARAALDFAVRTTNGRVLRPDNIRQSDLPWVQMHIAELSMKVEAAFLTSLQTAWEMDQGYAVAIANSSGERAKGAASTAVLDVTSKVFEICGGSSAMRRYPAERYYRDARTQTLMGPSYDFLLQVIGRGVIAQQVIDTATPASAKVAP